MHNVQMRDVIYIEVQCVWRLMGMKIVIVPYVIVIEYKFIKISLHVGIQFLFFHYVYHLIIKIEKNLDYLASDRQ